MHLIQNFYDDKWFWTLQFDTNLTELGIDSMSQEYEKARTSVPIISKSIQSIWMEFGLLLWFVGVVNFILTFPHPFSIQEREPYMYMWFLL